MLNASYNIFSPLQLIFWVLNVFILCVRSRSLKSPASNHPFGMLSRRRRRILSSLLSASVDKATPGSSDSNQNVKPILKKKRIGVRGLAQMVYNLTQTIIP